MAVYNATTSPIFDEVFTITSEFWEEPRNHRGLDITTGVNSPIRAIANGTVVFSGSEHDGQGHLIGYGNYIIIKETTTGMGFLYAHLRDLPLKNTGDSVIYGEVVGYEGTTGDSTGIHLHFEMQDISNHSWIYGAPREYYTNPATYMGIPNVEGVQAIYRFNPIPPTPTVKKRFPWVLYARKIRQVLNN